MLELPRLVGYALHLCHPDEVRKPKVDKAVTNLAQVCSVLTAPCAERETRGSLVWVLERHIKLPNAKNAALSFTLAFNKAALKAFLCHFPSVTSERKALAGVVSNFQSEDARQDDQLCSVVCAICPLKSHKSALLTGAGAARAWICQLVSKVDVSVSWLLLLVVPMTKSY